MQGDRIRQFYAASGASADQLLRAMCCADVRMSVPDRLPYGGSVQGVHDVVERIAQMRAYQTLAGGNEALLDDGGIVAFFSDVKWTAAAFTARGLQPPPDMIGTYWWFFRDDKVEEILFFYYDVGLTPAPRERAVARIAYPSWPTNTLHESNGLPYGGGDHHGMAEVARVIAEVVIWCDMLNVRLVAVASQGQHVSVLVASPFRGSDQRILIQEDWHLRAGKVAWYRAYYWDVDAVGRHYRQLKSGA